MREESCPGYEQCEKNHLAGSPTYLMNEGRQKLYAMSAMHFGGQCKGNVGAPPGRDAPQ